MGTMGILLPCDGSEPLPISVGDYLHIQQLVGGCFDAVSAEMGAPRFPDAPSAFTAVGYVHDEGLLIGLAPNTMASLMFDRHLVGDVVVVSGTSPEGEYDGDNHDVPSWFADQVFDGSLRLTANTFHSIATLCSDAVKFARQDGALDDEMYEALMAMMASGDDQYDDLIGDMLETCVVYMAGRKMGMPPLHPKHDDDQAVRDLLGVDIETALSDEAIASFLNQEEGK